MKYDQEKILKSAVIAVKNILDMNGVLEVHKKQLLGLMIWKITERKGKYNTEYISEESSKLNDIKQLSHEHVFTRKYLIEKLINNPEEYRDILKNAIGCTVTREEQKQLTKIKGIEGWDRYQKSGIKYFKNKSWL
jgi:vacuolar-type H+-ATPase subunit I/STV1